MRDTYSADISQFTAELYFPLDFRSGSEEVVTYLRTVIVAWKMQCYRENTTAFHGLSPDGLIQGCVTVWFGFFFFLECLEVTCNTSLDFIVI